MRTAGFTGVSFADFAADVRAGLTKQGQKELFSKYLYDDVGSALFEVICLLPEYGLTRADVRLLRKHAEEVARRVGSPAIVADLGSGNGKKARWVLEALRGRQRTVYCPIEISSAALTQCEKELSGMDSLSVVGCEKEYLDGLLEVAALRRPGEHLLVLFLGSTIGNFDRPAGEEFLRGVRRILEPGDALLLATDLEKSIPQLLLAYDDPLGVTAAFNLNLLARINRELAGDFVLRQFRHLVQYNVRERRIEMHLLSTVRQTARVPGAYLVVTLENGETIWTESSHKYDLDEVAGMAARTGFDCQAQWMDREWPFAHSFFRAT